MRRFPDSLLQSYSRNEHSLLFLFGSVLWCVLASLFITATGHVCADEPADITSRIQEIRVSPDRLPQLLNQEWQSLPYDEYQSLKKAAQPGLKAVWISRAEYSATLVNETLRTGTLSADVKHIGNQPRLLLLDPLNLVVTELKWEKEKAVWGSTPTGRTALQVTGAQSHLQGRWSLKGRKLPGGVEFDFRIAPSTVSRLKFLVPDHLILKSSTGIVVGPQPSKTTGWNSWQVILGSRTECRLTFRPGKQLTGLKPLILADTETSYIISQDGLRFETRVSFEVFEAPATHLDFELPAGVGVEEVRFVGNESALPFQIRKRNNKRRLFIPLPDPVQGRSRPLRIRSFASLDQNRSWTLPQLKLLNAVFLKGKIQLTVESPLELRVFQTHGLNQTEAVFDAAQRETFSFHQFLPDARLTVEVGHPRLDLTSRVFTHLNLLTDSRVLKSEVEWNAGSGTTFETRYSVSSQWEISEVRIGQKSSDFSSASNWNVKKNQDGSQLLELEFPESLDPDHPKTVQIFARQTPGSPNDDLTLPAIIPKNCRVIERELAVTHPATAKPELSRSTSFLPVPRDEVSTNFRESSLWDEISQAENGQLLLLSFTEPNSKGSMTFPRREPHISSQVRVSVSVNENNVREDYAVNITPLSSAVNQLFVFVTPPADDKNASLIWELMDGRKSPLKLKTERMPRSQSGPGELFSNKNGEMWAIHFPSPIRNAFEIRASRTRPETSSFTPSLIMVPGSGEFRGIVELAVAEGIDVDVNSRGLTVIPLSDQPPMPSDFSPEESESGRRSWRYDSPSDRLNLLVNTKGSTQPAHQTASLKLRSLIDAREAGNDIHWAAFYLEEDSRAGRFQFELPPPAVLTTVQLNGKFVEPLRDGFRFVLPPIPENRNNKVVIQYRCPSSGSFIKDSRNIVVPKTSYRVLFFDWEFALPPETRLAGGPESTTLLQPLAETSLAERFFGPLGRTAPWNQFDLKSLWNFSQQNSVTSSTGERTEKRDWVPSGLLLYRAAASQVPQNLTLETWSTPQVRLLEWVALIFCFVVGVLLRRFEITHREKIGAVWLSFCIVGAGVMPAVFAIIIGGGLSGSLLAMFLPNRIIRGRLILLSHQDSRTLGSTATFRNVPSTTLFITLGLLLTQSLAQNPSSESIRRPAPSTAQTPTLTLNHFTVLLPQNSDEDATRPPAVVYLHKQLIDQLEQAQEHRLDSTEYLMTSVDYRGRIDRQKHVTIVAKYQIAVLQGEKVTRVHFPITNANPGGSGSCLVNGSPQPLFLAPDGKGFVVELSKPGDAPVEALRPVHAETQLNKSSSLHRQKVDLYEVSLRLHPPIISDMRGGRFKIGIPPITASHFLLTLDDEAATARILGSQGESSQAEVSRTTITDLGRTDFLEVIWSSGDEPIDVPAELDVKIACLVEVHPTRLEFRYRLVYDIIKGDVDFITWNLPRDMVIRSVESKQLLRSPESSIESNGSQLLLDFSSQQQKQFVVDAAMTYPIRSAKDIVTIPPMELFAHSSKSYVTKITAYQVGVTTTSGFQLTPKPPFDDRITNVSPDTFAAFLSADEKTPSLGKPQFAYRLEKPTAMAFGFAPVTPHRKVRELRLIGQIRKAKIDWTLTAELEVTTPTAPAFGHRLIIDARLKIESLVVQEDDVNRLVRRIRKGNQVDLFLSEKTTGVQNITLKAFMPFTLSKEVPLPQIRFDGADSEEFDLLLYRDSNVNVEFPDPKFLSTAEDSEDESSENERGVFLGRFRLSTDDPLPLVRPIPQNSIATFDKATILNRQPDGVWKLKTILHIDNTDQAATRTSITVPPEMTNDFQILTAPEGHDTIPHDDGSIEIKFDKTQPTSDTFTVSLMSSLSPSRSDIWQLPTISTVNAELENHYFLLSPVDLYRPAAGESIPKSQRSSLPAWIGESASFPSTGENWNAFQSREVQWELKRFPAQDRTSAARIPLVLTRVEHNDPHGEFGCTELFLLSRTHRQLNLAWPDGIKLRALLVDGTVVNSPTDFGSDLKIPIDSTGDAHYIQVHWWREIDDVSNQIGSIPRDYPLPKNVPVERSLITVVPPRGMRFFPVRGFADLDTRQYFLEKLEGLLETARECFRSGSTHPEIWRILDSSRQGFEHRFGGKEDAANAGDNFSLQVRFDELSNEIERLLKASGQPAGQSDDTGDQLAFLGAGRNQAFTIAENRHQVFGRFSVEDANSKTTFWILGNDFLRWVAAVLGFVFILLVLWRLISIQAGEWLNRHQWVSWLLVGMFWLLCLKPAGIGLFVLLLGVLTALRQRKREKQQPQPAV